MWKVLVRGRFHHITITGDIKQAFLQVRIRKEDRAALLFHWLEDEATRQVTTLRFTRALFGLGPSPFLLGGVIQQHLENHRAEDPKCIEEIERSLYVDDLISGGQTVTEARRVKGGVTEIFSKAHFTLHKWHSNVSKLQTTPNLPAEDGETYAKQQLGIPKGKECGLLDRPGINIQIGSQVTVPRSLVKYPEEIRSINLHTFGDASGNGVAAAVYAMVAQSTGTSTGLVAAKAGLAKQGLTIPHLELVSRHMATNLVRNVKEALTGFPVQNVYGWLDSTVALHWICGGGDYKQFVHNPVQKIKSKEYITWRHVGPQGNPADLGSRGGVVTEDNELWW